MATPKVFVSYSWDDDLHRRWVADLSTRLRRDGIEVVLDQWHVVPGDQITEFMEREIRENDYVLVICTPRYKEKSDNRSGGVGYEGCIMTGELLSKPKHRKYIPVLARSSWSAAAPSWLWGKLYVDLSSERKYEIGYRELVQTIQGLRPEPPPVGEKPLIKQEVTSQSVLLDRSEPTSTRESMIEESTNEEGPDPARNTEPKQKDRYYECGKCDGWGYIDCLDGTRIICEACGGEGQIKDMD